MRRSNKQISVGELSAQFNQRVVKKDLIPQASESDGIFLPPKHFDLDETLSKFCARKIAASSIGLFPKITFPSS